MRLIVPLAVAAFVSLVGLPAGAETLHWSSPEGCPSAAEASASWEAMGVAPDAVEPEVEIAPGDGGWTATVRVGAGEDATVRVMRAEHCQELFEAVVLYVALIGGYDVDRAHEERRAVPEPEPRRVAAAPAERVTAAVGRRARVARTGPRRLRFLALAADVAHDRGSLPSPTRVGSARLSLGLSRVRFDLSASHWSPVRAAMPDEMRGARFALDAAGLATCVRIGGWVSACAGGELGRLRARSFGLRDPRHPTSLWIAAHAGVELRSEIAGGVDWVLGADATAPLKRDRYRFDGEEPLFRAPPALLRIRAGLAWRFFSPEP